MKVHDYITNGTARETARDFADVEAFVETLGALNNHPSPALRDLFAPGEDIYLTRAPGRLDLMGGIADYSGSLVLQLPIAEATLVALQKEERKTGDHTSPALRVVSLAPDGDVFHVEMPITDLTE